LTLAIDQSRNFVRCEPLVYFAENWENTLISWASLVDQTTSSTGNAVTDQSTAQAVAAIDAVIGGKHLPRLPQRYRRCSKLPCRFGYTRLSQFLDHLEERIRLHRKSGRYQSGRSDADLAIDEYLVAQEFSVEDTLQRKTLLRKKMCGDQWKQLCGPSEMLLTVFSEEADSLVYVFLSPCTLTKTNFTPGIPSHPAGVKHSAHRSPPPRTSMRGGSERSLREYIVTSQSNSLASVHTFRHGRKGHCGITKC